MLWRQQNEPCGVGLQKEVSGELIYRKVCKYRCERIYVCVP